MEASFSVSTNNRFAFFMGEEDDPGDMILQPESKTSEKIVADVSPSQKRNEKNLKQKEQKPPVQQQQVQGKKIQGEGTRRVNDKGQLKDKPEGGPRGDNRKQQQQSTGSFGGNRGGGGGENRPPRQNRNRGRLPSKEKQEGGDRSGGNADDTGGSRDNRTRSRWNDRGNREGGNRGDREEGRERNGDNYRPRAPRGGFRGGKREFERRSGNDKSSVKPLDKKEGAGSHNWGTVQDDLNTSVNDDWGTNDDGDQPPPPLPDVVPTENDTDPDNKTDKPSDESGEADTSEEPVEKEVEEVQLTLDEYKAQQDKKRFVPTFKERKPGENEDTTKWKDTFVYERHESELVPGTREVVEKYKSSGRVKTAVESNFFFKDTSRTSRGGGPGRRGGPGGRGGPDRRQFEERQGGRGGPDRRQFDDRQGGRGGPDRRQFDDRQGGRGGPDRRQFDDRQGGRGGPDRRQFDDRQGGRGGPDRRQFDDRQGGQEDRRPPRRSDGDRDNDRRPPRRFDDDNRRGGGNRTRDRSNFNVEDEKDFPSLGTVSA